MRRQTHPRPGEGDLSVLIGGGQPVASSFQLRMSVHVPNARIQLCPRHSVTLLLRILRPGADIHPKFSLPRRLKSAVSFLRPLLVFCHHEGQGSREALFFVFLKSSTDLLVTR